MNANMNTVGSGGRARRALRCLLLSALLLLLCAVGTACRGIGDSGEAPYDHLVTFDYNYGNLEANCPTQYLGVRDGGLVSIQPGYSDAFTLYEIKGHYLEGWYTAKTDGEGKPLKDSKTGMVLLDSKWDFETGTVGADMTLYARWVAESVLSFVDRETGELLYSMRATPGTSRKLPVQAEGAIIEKMPGHTVYGYFADAECTQPFTFPHIFGETDETVYVSLLEGTWLIVRTPAAFQKGVNAGANLYLDADLDFSQVATGWQVRDFGGTLNGNGHTIRGITLTLEGSRNKSNNFALFGTLRSKAYLHDVTFADVNISFSAKVNGTYAVAGFAWAAESGARVENVTLTGLLTYDFASAPTSTVTAWIAENGMKPEDANGCDYSGLVLRDAAAG